MKALKKLKEWLKRLKEDLEKESVSQVNSVSPCCSRPIEPKRK